jgi:G3E family GTPase
MVPVTLITGFLGAGKTTLMTHLLREAHGLKLAVLVNDFGALNLDAEVLGQESQDVVALENGCICCSLSSGLLSAVNSVIRRSDPPDRILIEASGISDPVEVAQALADPELAPYAPLDGIVAVVDALGLPDLTGDALHLAQRQIVSASLVVLNKIDLVQDKDPAQQAVRAVSRSVPIIETTQGALAFHQLLGLGTLDTTASTPSAPHAFETRLIEVHAPLPLQRLHGLLSRMPPSVLRIKGDVFLVEKPEHRCHLQFASGAAAVTVGQPWADNPQATRLVFIAPSGVLDALSIQEHLYAATVPG